MNAPPIPLITIQCSKCGFNWKTTNQSLANIIAAKHTAENGPSHLVSDMPIVADIAITGQNTSVVALTPFYAVPANAGGMYRVNMFCVVATPATTSSTLPNTYLAF